MDVIDRLKSNPTLRPAEWKHIADMLPHKKKDIASAIGIEPETLSRIFGGKPTCIASEKLFRLLGLAELMPSESDMQRIEKHAAWASVVALQLSPMELVE